MSDSTQEHEHHGHSVAIWTAVAIILVGSALMCLAVVLLSVPLFVAGALVCVVGTGVGVALSKAGYGAPKLLAPGVAAHTGGGGADAPEGTPAAGVN